MKVRGVSANLYVGNNNPRWNLIRLVTLLLFPRFLVLQEAKNFKGTIPGYKAYRSPRGLSDSNDDQNNVILVRRGTKIVDQSWEMVHDGDWQYEDNKREARVYGRLTMKLRKKLIDIYAVHRCPLGPLPPRPVNRKAWIAEHRFLLKWDRERTAIWAADWNTRVTSSPKDEYSLRELAQDLGARMNVIGIDGFLTTRDISVRKVRQLKDKFGSDKHSPVVIDFEI